MCSLVIRESTIASGKHLVCIRFASCPSARPPNLHRAPIVTYQVTLAIDVIDDVTLGNAY
ncbi:hypothetical protein TIFTF001_012695 [Ficus carica]|uniref:Uncharacterized protein n=1 Tax=Ficus carica TaxID=3494 RepID=A0AA88D247_FICCA|nr:hypothetical protein TIFTF001_012695 [Ficus carica]